MEIIEQLSVALGVIALLVAGLFWLQRRGLTRTRWIPRSSEKNMQVVERLHLTPQHSLHLVRVGGRQLLIAASPHNCQVLEANSGASGPAREAACAGSENR